MLETLTIEDDGKVALPDAVQTRYGFKPNTAIRLIETSSGVLLIPLTDAPMNAELQAELEDWQALGAESLAGFPFENEQSSSLVICIGSNCLPVAATHKRAAVRP